MSSAWKPYWTELFHSRITTCMRKLTMLHNVEMARIAKCTKLIAQSELRF